VSAAKAEAGVGFLIREAGTEDVEGMAVIEELTSGYWSALELAVSHCSLVNCLLAPMRRTRGCTLGNFLPHEF